MQRVSQSLGKDTNCPFPRTTVLTPITGSNWYITANLKGEMVDFMAYNGRCSAQPWHMDKTKNFQIHAALTTDDHHSLKVSVVGAYI